MNWSELMLGLSSLQLIWMGAMSLESQVWAVSEWDLNPLNRPPSGSKLDPHTHTTCIACMLEPMYRTKTKTVVTSSYIRKILLVHFSAWIRSWLWLQRLDTRKRSTGGGDKTVQATLTYLHQNVLHLIMKKHFKYMHNSCISCERHKLKIGGT